MSKKVSGCSEKHSSAITLLTAGRDKPYALGLAFALIEQGVAVDYLGSDAVDDPDLRRAPLVRFLNLRDQRENAGLTRKVLRVVFYYLKLIGYSISARPKLFHILWNNKFEVFDRTVLTLFYKLVGKKIVLTAHNVNAGLRDGNDSLLNRWSLAVQYRLADHIFVHSNQMKAQLVEEFKVLAAKVTVIPFGINNTVPTTRLTAPEARKRLGIGGDEKTVLFFGNIAPYKGLEHLVAAIKDLSQGDRTYRLVIAGRPKGCEDYWAKIKWEIDRSCLSGRVTQKIAFIPDDEVEVYFKAADVLVLPYNYVFQSGVLFLGYSFGLPVVVSDVGSLREEVVAGQTGFVCRPHDPPDLARCLSEYFGSDLFRHLAQRREKIRQFANERYSWTKVGAITRTVYANLAGESLPEVGLNSGHQRNRNAQTSGLTP
jgi:glycosyltransferase involved in cell wall biosynthesis